VRIAAVFLALAVAGDWQITTSAPALAIDGDAGIVTVFVRPDKVAEFDQLLGRLKSALANSANPARRAQADGWQVFTSLDRVQGNVAYLMRVDPAVRDQDYDMARLIGEAEPAAAADVARSIRDAQAGRSMMAMNRVNIDGLGQAAAGGPADRGVTPPASLVQSFPDADAAVITVLVHPERAGDYEAVLARMAKAMQASPVSIRKQQAASWKVYRGTQLLTGALPYITIIDPVQPRSEYDPIRLIQEVFPSEVPQIFARYRAAFAGQAVVTLGQRVELRR
jgi:hypothetical protein